jgi:hypothetical protein
MQLGETGNFNHHLWMVHCLSGIRSRSKTAVRYRRRDPWISDEGRGLARDTCRFFRETDKDPSWNGRTTKNQRSDCGMTLAPPVCATPSSTVSSGLFTSFSLVCISIPLFISMSRFKLSGLSQLAWKPQMEIRPLQEEV